MDGPPCEFHIIEIGEYIKSFTYSRRALVSHENLAKRFK